MIGATPPSNGHSSEGAASPEGAPAPVQELADACVRYVQAVFKIQLDYHAETLSVLDHYIRSRRQEVSLHPETAGLLARVIGAYFGEVIRRKIPSFWHLPSEDGRAAFGQRTVPGGT